MKWAPAIMSEAFFMSNMSPQTPGFNRGIWKRLESQVRGWAIENRSVYIATGGGRSGVILGAGMGQVIADLISTGATDMNINEFDPDRFRD